MGYTKASAAPRMAAARLVGRRSKGAVHHIPSGKSRDLAELLAQSDKVHVHTVDGIGIDVEKTSQTKVGTDHIAGLRFTIVFLGVRVEGRYGSCQRYLTAWDNINPRRDGQRWRFAFDENRGQTLTDGYVFVQFVV